VRDVYFGRRARPCGHNCGFWHDASGIALYFQKTLTFLTYTDEAMVVLEA
jgi:hypothetical protein